jgi:hypothetical protein
MAQAQLAETATSVLTHLHPSGSGSASAHLAVAAGRLASLPAHPMTAGRIVFLAVLVLFFCVLFVGAYVWMRRPNFGQLEGGRRMKPQEGTGPPGLT